MVPPLSTASASKLRVASRMKFVVDPFHHLGPCSRSCRTAGLPPCLRPLLDDHLTSTTVQGQTMGPTRSLGHCAPSELPTSTNGAQSRPDRRWTRFQPPTPNNEDPISSFAVPRTLHCSDSNFASFISERTYPTERRVVNHDHPPSSSTGDCLQSHPRRDSLYTRRKGGWRIHQKCLASGMSSTAEPQTSTTLSPTSSVDGIGGARNGLLSLSWIHPGQEVGGSLRWRLSDQRTASTRSSCLVLSIRGSQELPRSVPFSGMHGSKDDEERRRDTRRVEQDVLRMFPRTT